MGHFNCRDHPPLLRRTITYHYQIVLLLRCHMTRGSLPLAGAQSLAM